MQKTTLIILLMIFVSFTSCNKEKSKEKILQLIEIVDDSATSYPLFVGGKEYLESGEGELLMDAKAKTLKKVYISYPNYESFILKNGVSTIEEGTLELKKMNFEIVQNNIQIIIPWHSFDGLNTAELNVSFNLPFHQLNITKDLIPMEIKKKLVDLQPERYINHSNDSFEQEELYRSIKLDSTDIKALINYESNFDFEMRFAWHLYRELEKVIENIYQLNYRFGTDYWYITGKKNLNKLDFLELLNQLEIQLGEDEFKLSVGYSVSELSDIFKELDKLTAFDKKIKLLMKNNPNVSYLEELSKFPTLKRYSDEINAYKTKYGNLDINQFKLPMTYSDGTNTIKITSFNQKLNTFSANIYLEGKSYLLKGDEEHFGKICHEPTISKVDGINRTDISKRYNSANTLNYSLSPNGFDERYGPGVGPPIFYIELVLVKTNNENLLILESGFGSDIKLKKIYYLKLI